MLARRHILGFALIGATILATAQISVAKNPHHNNGHAALGAKLEKDGKHEVGKAGKHTVTADIKGKKVVAMSADNLPVRKVKSSKKMAGVDGGLTRLAANGEFKVAQVDYSYGYCFTDGIDEYCYWYPASDVIITDTWIEYTPI